MSEHLTPQRLESPLARARGLGSSRGGTHHWWLQRVTSMALLPLTLWFAFAVASLAGSPYEVVARWIGQPFNATLLILTVAIGFHHTASGLQVVVEDYVRPESRRALVILAMKGLFLLLGVLSVLSVLRLVFRA
ncbi:succinate dehydrogenase, hydrophobic membrane anchor protein [Roseomonas sp. CCTCC AB2023176]|uniref:succinate dehydrogenase, hydrophobic membrane anchor protein n=1 Tax=Roseomonas sp. CCTCC AB2023176 TaxID=3342640 RepID=UPI0035E06539